MIYIGQIGEKEFTIPFFYNEKPEEGEKDIRTALMLGAVIGKIYQNKGTDVKLWIPADSDRFLDSCMQLFGEPEQTKLVNEYVKL